MTDQQIRAAKDQELSIDKLVKFYNEGENELGFFGKAGVGKTRSAKELAERISNLKTSKRKPKIIGATIAHSAKNILQQSLGEGIPVMTIASLLQLRRKIDDDTGEITFEPETVYSYDRSSGTMVRKVPPITTADILIIDECSQIGQDMKDLIDQNKRKDAVVIYLGDYHQTPPVEDDRIKNQDSPTFDVEGVTLTIPYRYEGELQQLADAVAAEIDRFNETGECSLKFLKEFAEKESEAFKFYRKENEFKSDALQEFKNQPDLKHSTVICYRNDTVKKDTTFFRNHLVQSNYNYVSGDKVVAKEPYFNDLGTMVLQTHSLYNVVSTFQTMYVVVLSEGRLVDFFENTEQRTERDINSSYPEEYNVVYLESYMLELEDEDGNIIKNVPVLREFNDRKFAFVKNALYNRCKALKKDWKIYYEIVEHFATLNYAYTVNSHVVQGDTYDRVFVNFRDILTVKPISLKEKLQSLYTAITRAKHHASILI
jgi:hypothetical protein